MSEELSTAQPVEEPTPPPADPPADDPPADPPAPSDDVEAAIEENAIDIPDGDRLVPVKAVVAPLREKLRTAKAEAERLKAEAERSGQLEQELQAVRAKNAEAEAVVAAARALLEQSRQQAQPAPTEDTSELQEIARDLDLWKADGTPDLDRARRIQQRQLRTAEQIAAQATAPILAETLQQKAAINLARAKMTKLADGTQADPAILDSLWGQLAAQPNGLQTLANETSAVHLYNQALALTVAQRAGKPKAPTIPAPPPPLHVEAAGGRDSVVPKLSESDKRVARDLGLSEKQYAEEVAKMPWRAS